jgi:hypothetical protein
MAETIKSALFVDYDSFHRSQDDENGDAAERLAQTSAVWVSALEGGKLVLPPPENGARRRVLIRRCYADPALLGLHRSALIASGFEVIDCPHQPGRKRNAADLHMVIDTLDALDHPAGYDEFILLSADTDLTPVLLRLRAHNRNTVVYGDEATTASYKSIADGMIDAARFAAVLAGDAVEEKVEKPAVEATSEGAEPAGAPAVAADRNDIEALARKVHAATNVPMFSPRTFADLFRVLAQEIGEHGYHFQNTAENVTDKLVAAGRNANRRQVLFVVKGLALKGHVFSTTDTPERLADAFREQVIYLIGSSGLDLDERETAMLPNWIIGRTPTVAKPVPTATPPKPAPPVEDSAKKTTPVRRRVTRPAPSAKEDAALVARAEPPRPEAPARPEPAAEKRPPSPVTSPSAKPAPAAGVGIPTPASRGADLRASVASRFAAITKGSFSAKPGSDTAARPQTVARPAATESRPVAAESRPAAPRPPVRPSPAGRPANGGPGAARPAATRAAAPKPAPAEGENDALESSILAAIAQAVDVLVDDDAAKARDTGQENEVEAVAVEVSAPPTSQPEPPPDPEPSPGGDSEDIGDEIQRIIASYSRARTQSE